MMVDQKIKVLHIITRLDPGGSAQNTLDSVVFTNSEDYDVALLYGKTEDLTLLSSYQEKHSFKKYFFSSLQRDINPFLDLWCFFKLVVFLHEHRFDIVHTHTSKAGILGRWAAWLSGVPHIIHTPHGHVFYGYFNEFVTKVFLWVEQLTVPITDKIICLTELGKKEHLKYGVGREDKLKVIHSGVDMNVFQSLEQTLFSDVDVDKKIIVGVVARLEPVKGIDVLIDAVPLILNNSKNVEFWIVGDGTEKNNLKEKVSKIGLEDKVLFYGHRDDVQALISEMDIFVLPSRNEGMGRVIVEAMALGKPVVASKVGGVPDLVEHDVNGMLVPSEDPEALSKKILDLIVHKDKRIVLGERGRKKVQREYSLQKMISDIENLYQDLVSEG